MKQVIIILLSIISLNVCSQNSLPTAQVFDAKGKKVMLQDFIGKGKPVYVTFWALWCTNCIKELNAIKDDYEVWKKETGVEIIAISIDDERNKSKVIPFANAKEWDYTILLDPNSDLKRALNINNIPFSILFDAKGNIVKQHSGYTAGDETALYEELKKLAELPKTIEEVK